MDNFIPDSEFVPDEKQPKMNEPGNLFYQGAKFLLGDKKQDEGVTESMSPIDFISPSMVTAPAKMAVQGVKAAAEAAPRILANEVGAVGSLAAKTKPNQLGMYSKLEHTIENKMGGSATPDQIMAMIKNNDVKPDEIKYTKLDEFLSGKNKVTKDEVLSHVRENQLPIEEKVLGVTGNKLPEGFDVVEKKGGNFYVIDKNYPNRNYSIGSTREEAISDYLNIQSKTPTKFSDYTLPGGENYREKLYTLPQGKVLDGREAVFKKWQPEIDAARKKLDQASGSDRANFAQNVNNLENKRDLEAMRIGDVDSSKTYKSSHFDEPNILAHTRLNDRVDAQGKKHLFVEEIQSDWHQAGRKQGYKNTNLSQDKTDIESKIHAETKKLFPGNEKLAKSYAESVIRDTNSGYVALTPEAPKELQELTFRLRDIGKQNSNSVPDAPFKKNWHEFVSKNLLSDAAKGGYDNVSWTTGEQQGARYPQLIDHLNSVEWHVRKDGVKSVLLDLKKGGESILDLDNSGNIINGKFSGKSLSDVIGKEQANKIVSGGESGVIKGDGLIVGAEGMKGFYDKMIPDYMAKIGKRFGVKPELVDLETRTKVGQIHRDGPNSQKVWTMKITPEMRDSLLKEGLPLFSVGGAMIGSDANAQPQGYAHGGIVGYANGGVVDPNFIPDDQFISDEDKYGSTSEQFKTFGQAAASAATFGLSDQALVRSGLMDAEKARLRLETNPGVAMAGEITGIGGSMLIPGSAVGRMAKGAEALSGLVSPTTGKVISKLINPELYPTAHKILSKAGSTAVGSALEGSVYGAGKSISEDAIGDHELSGESLFSNMGMGALYGGVAGGAIGGILGAIKPKAANSAKDILDTAGVDQTTDFVSRVANSSLPQKEKDGILSGLSKQKSNIKDIEKAATDLGVDVSVGQRSDDKLVQDVYSMYAQAATAPGYMERQKIAENFKKVSDKIGETLGGSENLLSKAELGQSLSESLTAKNEARIEPIKQLYSYLKDSGKAIDFTENERLELMQGVQDWVKDQNFLKGSFGHDFGNKVIDAVAEAKNYDQLDSLAKSLWKSSGGYENKWIAQGIRNVLETKADDILINFAEQVGASDVTNEIAMKVAGARAAKSAYRDFMVDAQKLSGVLGVNKLHGPQHFFDVLAEKRPEMIADRLFAKENSRFVKYFSEKFPEEWGAIKQYQKGKIFSDSLKNGEIEIGKVLKKLDKLEPEMKKALFTPAELKTLKSAETWLDAFPANVNPSKTDITRAIRDFFESPVSAATQTARDYAFKAGFKALGLSSGETKKYQMLRKIEKQAIETQKIISGNIKFALSLGDKEVKRNFSMNDDDRKKMEKDVQNYANNPEHFIDHLDKNTENLFSNAPSINSQFQSAAIRANQFLAGKLPQVPTKKPLGNEYVVSKAEVSKFMRYVDAVNNPTNLLTEIKFGNITRETLEAVSSVYPRLFSKMQEEALNNISDMTPEKISKLPYKVKMGFSMLLGTDLAIGLDSKSIIANQANLLNPNSKQSGEDKLVKTSQKGLSSITASNSILTDSQKAAKDISA